jgi:hypothetical protein
MPKTIAPDEAAELKRLYVELAVAYQRAADTLRVGGRPLRVRL